MSADQLKFVSIVVVQVAAITISFVAVFQNCTNVKNSWFWRTVVIAIAFVVFEFDGQLVIRNNQATSTTAIFVVSRASP